MDMSGLIVMYFTAGVVYSIFFGCYVRDCAEYNQALTWGWMMLAVLFLPFTLFTFLCYGIAIVTQLVWDFLDRPIRRK